MLIYVSSQQYAYARTTDRDSVVVVFNNDKVASHVEFEVDQLRLPNSSTFTDRLGISRDIEVKNGKLLVNLPARSVAILVGK